MRFALLLLSLGTAVWGKTTYMTEYTPYPGIPTPSFGLTESVDMYLDPGKTYDYQDDGGTGAVVYRTANGKPYTYYVDRTHGSATDTANPHGSPSTPRLTWPYPLQAGDCVQIHGTGYTANNAPSSTMRFGGPGTVENPIFFYGVEALKEDYPSISKGTAVYLHADYLIVEKLRFVNDTPVQTRPLLRGAPVTNVCIRHCYWKGNADTSAGVCTSTGGSSGSDVDNYTLNFVVWDCVMEDHGDWTRTDLEIDACGAIFSQHATNCWMLDVEAFHINGDGVRLGADQGDMPSGGFYYVAGCHFHHNKENGVDIKQAHNFVVASCLMNDFADSETSGGEAVVIHYDGSNGWFINNRVSSCIRGFVGTGFDDADMYWIGNLFHDITEYAMYPDRGGGTFHIWNNTVANCANGIVSTGIVDGLDIKGNLIVNVTGFYLQVSDSGVRAASTVSNELYFEDGGAVSISWSATYTSVAAWIAGTTVGDNSVEADPLLSSYRLGAGSPAIGAGVDWSAADTVFQADFGVTMLKDYDGNVRPVNTWDIGAFEFAEGGGGGEGALNVGTLNVGGG